MAEKIIVATKPRSGLIYFLGAMSSVAIALTGIIFSIVYFKDSNPLSGTLYTGASMTIMGILSAGAMYVVYRSLMGFGFDMALIPLIIVLVTFIVVYIVLINESAHLCAASAYWDENSKTCKTKSGNVSTTSSCGECLDSETCVSGKCCLIDRKCGLECCSASEKCTEGRCCETGKICGSSCCSALEQCTNGSCCVKCGTSGQCCLGGTICVDGTCQVPCGYDSSKEPVYCSGSEICMIVADLDAADKASIIKSGGRVGEDPADPNREVAFICSSDSSKCTFDKPTSYPGVQGSGATTRYLCAKTPKSNITAGLNYCFPADPSAPTGVYEYCGKATEESNCSLPCTWVDLQVASVSNATKLDTWIQKGLDNNTFGYYCNKDGESNFSRVSVIKESSDGLCNWQDCFQQMSEPNVTNIRWQDGYCSQVQACTSGSETTSGIKRYLLTTKTDTSGAVRADSSQLIPTGNSDSTEYFPTCATGDNTAFCDSLSGKECNPLDGSVLTTPVFWKCVQKASEIEGSSCQTTTESTGYTNKADCEAQVISWPSYTTPNGKTYDTTTVTCGACRNDCSGYGTCLDGICTCEKSHESITPYNFDCAYNCNYKNGGTSSFPDGYYCEASDDLMSSVCSGGQWTYPCHPHADCRNASQPCNS